MPLDQTKFRLGPCNVYMFENAAWVHIGYVDNTEVTFTPSAANLLGGQNGTSPMDSVITGLEGGVAFDCQQIELTNWFRALRGNSQKFQGVVTPANHRLEMQTKAGYSLRNNAAVQLKVVPLVGGIETTNAEEILIVPIAVPRPETVTLAFGNTAQRVLRMNYMMFADDTKRNRLAYFGDDTADTSAVGAW